MIINRKAFRDIWIFRWQSLAIIIVVACGVAILSGVDMAFKSLEFTREKIYNELNFADLEILFIPDGTELIPDFHDIEGIQTVEKRVVFPGSILLDNNKKLSGVFTLVESPQPQVNSFRIVKGNPINFSDLKSVVLEQSLAKYHGFKPGDVIKIKIGEKVYENSISGVIISPEYVTGTTNPDFFSPGKGTLGAIFGNVERNREALGFSMTNDLIFKFSKGADPASLRELILKKLNKLNIEKVIPNKEHFSYKYMDLELHGFDLYTPAIIIIMGILSFTTGFVIYNRFVIIQRKEIGTLLCLGYTAKEIIYSFLLGTLALGILGSLSGLVSSLLVRDIFAYFQSVALDLPVLYTGIYLISLIKGIVFGVIITIIPPLLLLPKLFKLSPHEIIRNSVKEGAFEKGILVAMLEKLPFKSLEFKYTVRNMIRQKWLTISTIVCIGLSIGVAIAYVASITSVNQTVTDSFNYEDWDLGVDFLYPMYLDEIEAAKKIPGVVKYEPLIRRFAEIKANTSLKDSSVLGINPTSAMKRVRLIDGKWFSGTNEKEIILNRDISDALGVGVGQWVEIKINEEYFKSKVVGITSEFSVGQSLIPFTEAQQIFEYPDEATGMFVNINEAESNIETIKNAFYEFEYVGSVTKKSEVLGELLRLMHDLMGIVYLSAGFSVIVALVFIYTNINLVIFERKGEFALLRSLGYQGKNIRKIISSQSLINGIMGCIFSIPVAMLTTAVLNQRLGKAWYHVYNHFVVSDFLLMTIPALALMPLMTIPAVKFINNFKLSEIIHQKTIE